MIFNSNSKPLFITIIAQSYFFLYFFLPKTLLQTSLLIIIFLFNRLMDSPKLYLSGLKTSLTLILIISLTLFPSNSGSGSTKDVKGVKQKKLVLGSRPPKCVNKCLNCRPCMAALVISPHHKFGHIHKATTTQRDEGYYLLSWKCKCGNKFFQP